MDRYLTSECSSSGVESPSSSYRPQSRYLAYLLDQFEKCTLQTNGLSQLQKDYKVTKKELFDAQNDIRELKAQRKLHNEKIAQLERQFQEQKLLHVQLRDEMSNEFRTLYRHTSNLEKDTQILKHQAQTNTKKNAMELENLQWEMTANRRAFDDFRGITELTQLQEQSTSE